MGRSLLLAAVIGMGILIVLGMIALVYGLIQKADNPDFKFFDLSTEAPQIEEALKSVEVPLVGKKSAPVISAQSPAQAFGDLRIELPAGYKIVATDMDSQRLILRLENAQSESKLILLDINTGARLGTLSLQAAQ
jgi:hypothetical protein